MYLACQGQIHTPASKRTTKYEAQQPFGNGQEVGGNWPAVYIATLLCVEPANSMTLYLPGKKEGQDVRADSNSLDLLTGETYPPGYQPEPGLPSVSALRGQRTFYSSGRGWNAEE